MKRIVLSVLAGIVIWSALTLALGQANPWVNNAGVPVTPMAPFPSAAVAGVATNALTPQRLYVFIGDSRLTNNPVVGTNVWPFFFMLGHEPCVVSNYAVAGITAQTIWSTWSQNGGQLPNPGRPYNAFVAAGVNDIGASYNTSVTTSNIAFAALTNIWYWERTNGAKPVVAFTIMPNFNDLGSANYFLNWTNLNALILSASNSPSQPWGWDVCVNEGQILNLNDTGDSLHQNTGGVVKEVGAVNAALQDLNGFYYPSGDFLNATGPYFPDRVTTNASSYCLGNTAADPNYGPVSIGWVPGGVNTIYTYQNTLSFRDDGGGGGGFNFVNGSINVLHIPHVGGMSVYGGPISEPTNSTGALPSPIQGQVLWTYIGGTNWFISACNTNHIP